VGEAGVAGDGAVSPTGVPQELQKRWSLVSAAPHSAQAKASEAPQLPQNLLAGGLPAPHTAHAESTCRALPVMILGCRDYALTVGG
jgi:hypothetical protein